jgi:hypothetical protein
MAKKSNGAAARITAASARTIAPVNVASPYEDGIDRVERVFDSVECMLKRGQIDRSQHMAAQTYRLAFDALNISLGRVVS